MRKVNFTYDGRNLIGNELKASPYACSGASVFAGPGVHTKAFPPTKHSKEQMLFELYAANCGHLLANAVSEDPVTVAVGPVVSGKDNLKYKLVVISPRLIATKGTVCGESQNDEAVQCLVGDTVQGGAIDESSGTPPVVNAYLSVTAVILSDPEREKIQPKQKEYLLGLFDFGMAGLAKQSPASQQEFLTKANIDKIVLQDFTDLEECNPAALLFARLIDKSPLVPIEKDNGFGVIESIFLEPLTKWGSLQPVPFKDVVSSTLDVILRISKIKLKELDDVFREAVQHTDDKVIKQCLGSYHSECKARLESCQHIARKITSDAGIVEFLNEVKDALKYLVNQAFPEGEELSKSDKEQKKKILDEISTLDAIVSEYNSSRQVSGACDCHGRAAEEEPELVEAAKAADDGQLTCVKDIESPHSVACRGVFSPSPAASGGSLPDPCCSAEVKTHPPRHNGH